MRVVLALLVLAGCGNDGGSDSGICVVGDLSAEPEVELVYRTVGGTMEALGDGTAVPLQTPPQGGKVIYVGVRVKNVDLCGASLQAAVRDPCTNRVLGI